MRHVGGVTRAAWPEPSTRESRQRYARESIILEYAAPYGEDTESWHDFDLRVVGKRMTITVDGEVMADFEDAGKTPKGTLAWQPLTAGGWIGLRNFRATWVDVDFIKVYRRDVTEEP